MFNFSNNLESFITHRGLYRVWVSMHDDGKAPLVSIWIDPGMKAFEPQDGKEHITLSGVKGDDSIPEELVEPPGPCLRASRIKSDQEFQAMWANCFLRAAHSSLETIRGATSMTRGSILNTDTGPHFVPPRVGSPFRLSSSAIRGKEIS
jgi:hypothetical protein